MSSTADFGSMSNSSYQSEDDSEELDDDDKLTISSIQFEQDYLNEGNGTDGISKKKVSICNKEDVDSNESSDAISSPASEAIDDWQDRSSSPDLPQEYWQVQRLIKYIKAGNSTATIISLASLKDYNIQDPYIQMAIKDSGGLEVLLNILETEEIRCKRASLTVIRDITNNTDISRSIYNMKGLETLVKCLSDPTKEVKVLAAETISNLCKIKKARRAMRKINGIIKLVDMLDYEHGSYKCYTSPGTEWDLEVPKTAGKALWSLAKSSKNREAIRLAGAIPYLSKLIRTNDVGVVIPTVGILQECAAEPAFRSAICRQGILADFITGLQSSNPELVQYSAQAIHICVEPKDARKIIYKYKAIEPLMTIIADPNLKQNKTLLTAATGAIYKCSGVIFGNSLYIDRGIIELLVSLLETEPEEVTINVAGTIEEIAKSDISYSTIIRRANGISALLRLLTLENEELLVNVTRAVGVLAKDKESRIEIEALDGFRLVWSLLRHSSPLVQSSAAWAICPYVKSSKNSSEMVRNYVGGLESLVKLLLSDNILVQSAVCEAVAAIALNIENLAIMSDHGVVGYLARIAISNEESDLLKRCLSTAVAECCKWGHNSTEFGQLNSVSPICQYLNSKDQSLLREATKALCTLSTDPKNCITIHQCGVVKRLIKLTGSLDHELRESAAAVMANIRCLALSTEKIRFQQY